MARLVGACLALVLVLLPAASAAGPLEILRLDPGEEAARKVDHARSVAAELAADVADGARAPLDDPALVSPGDAWDPRLDAAFAVLLGLAAATALGVAGGARFSTPAEVLENPVRQRVYGYLRERTGATLKQLTGDLGLTTTNAIWHLRKLEDSGLVHSRRFNGFKVFYPAEGGVAARRLSLSRTALQNGNAQEVFEYVLAHPGAHQREIARALAVNHGTVRWHLKKLRGAELLTEERRGKTSTYVATDVGKAALDSLRAQTPAPLVALPPTRPLSS